MIMSSTFAFVSSLISSASLTASDTLEVNPETFFQKQSRLRLSLFLLQYPKIHRLLIHQIQIFGGSRLKVSTAKSVYSVALSFAF